MALKTNKNCLNQIDELFYQLYDLMEDEIKIIQS